MYDTSTIYYYVTKDLVIISVWENGLYFTSLQGLLNRNFKLYRNFKWKNTYDELTNETLFYYHIMTYSHDSTYIRKKYRVKKRIKTV